MELLPIHFISDFMGKVVQKAIQLLLQAAMMETDDMDLFQLVSGWDTIQRQH